MVRPGTGQLLLVSTNIRRSLGLHPYCRRKRRLAYRTPCGLLDAFSAQGPVGISRVGCMTSLCSLEGPPVAGDDVISVVSTLRVATPSRRNMMVVHEIAALLAELADARRALATATSKKA